MGARKASGLALSLLLAATAGAQFDVMDTSAKGNRAKWQRVAQFRWSLISRNDGRSDLKAIWCENVTQFPIAVFNKPNARGAVRVVLNPDHLRRDAVLAPSKIDFSIFLLVAAADVSRRKSATVVASPGSFPRLKKPSLRPPLRDFIESR